MIKRILAPTDGSAISRKAVNYAAELAKQVGASLTLLGVIDSDLLCTGVSPQVSPTNIRESTEDLLRQATQAYLDKSLSECRTQGWRGHRTHGAPGRGDREPGRRSAGRPHRHGLPRKERASGGSSRKRGLRRAAQGCEGPGPDRQEISAGKRRFQCFQRRTTNGSRAGAEEPGRRFSAARQRSALSCQATRERVCRKRTGISRAGRG